MLCRMAGTIAAVSLVVVVFSGAPARGCSNDKFQCEPGPAGVEKPFLFEDYVDRIFNRKPSPAPMAPDETTAKRAEPRRASQPRKPRAAATPPVDAPRTEELPTEVVPIVVKTTSEPPPAAPPHSVVSPEEWNEIDRLATMQNVASRPSTDGSGGAERAAAMTEAPQPRPSKSNAMLELVVMTFGGMLAAVSALRIFAA